MSGTDGALRLIELTSARLCHDIGGLTASLNQPVESGANGSLDPHEKAAIKAARALAARLALHHSAWCPGAGHLSLVRLKSLAAGAPDGVILDVSALDQDTEFSPAAGRIVLNLLLLAADSLPSGGTISLAGDADDLFIKIGGPAAAWPVGMAACLANEAEARSALTEPRGLQMALTVLLARAAGIRLSVLLSAGARDEPAILRLGG